MDFTLARPSIWNTKEILLFRNEFFVGVLGNSLAVFGGEPIVKTRQSEIYDAATQTWNLTDVYLDMNGRDNGALVTIPCDFNEVNGCEECTEGSS